MNDVNGYDSTIKYAIMDIVGAINKIESMKQDRYLAMHPYSITHSADGYYRTYLPADDGKRKQIKRNRKAILKRLSSIIGRSDRLHLLRRDMPYG